MPFSSYCRRTFSALLEIGGIMNTRPFVRRFTAFGLAATLWLVPLAAMAQQTVVTTPKNKYKVQDDIKLGNDAAREVERQFPLLNDYEAQDYVSRVGERLVSAIPPQFRQSQFDYRFKVVNARDLNAFALPGGPMYVNRGMIEAARNEGELAGVMAHEISHVALRHATAQATKNSSAGNTLRTLGLILGGAVVGGQAGAQLGAIAAQSFMLKYSREYETQADTLGSQIMADAGYDPRDLANVFRTIEQQSGGNGPQWLSSHPNPGNRYAAINREAQYLRIAERRPIKSQREFQQLQGRLRDMPRARSMAEIQRDYESGRGQVYNNGGYSTGTSTGRYSNSVQYPSTRMQTYSLGGVSMSVPSNWQQFPGRSDVQFAPEGAFGDQGITHGVLAGLSQGSNYLNRDAQNYVNEILQNNTYLRQQGGISRTTFGGRSGYYASLSGRSPVTGHTEIDNVYITQLRNGQLFYVVTVVPDEEQFYYSNAFRNMLNSVRFND
jgi:Zn-dependent protease with chaperone function